MAEKKLKRPRDPVSLAKLIGDIATGLVADRADDGKNPKAVEAGRKGGAVGGKVRARNMTSAQRKKAAQKAAKSRWEKA